MPETTRDTEVKETNQSGFNPAGVESLLDVDERGKGVLVAVEAQGVHKTEGQSVGTPTKTARSAGGERNGTIGVKSSGGHRHA